MRPQAAAAFDATAQSFLSWNADGPAFLNSLGMVLEGSALWVQVSRPALWRQLVLTEPGAIPLAAGFNLVTWVGPGGLAAADAVADLSAVEAVFAYDPTTEIFSSFGPDRPAFLNDLASLPYGTGIWVLSDVADTWTQPAAPPFLCTAQADGTAALEIPPGALADVDASAIEIRDATNPENPDVLTWELLPTGLQLDAPVTFTFATDLDAPGGVGLLADGETFELVDLVSALDLDANGVLHAVQLQHFSFLTIVSTNFVGGIFDGLFPCLRGCSIGQSFSIDVKKRTPSFSDTPSC